jgi:hypothetical protein
MTWRDKARPVIADVIRRVGRGDDKALRSALRDAYPFGVRKYHPYRIWCDEVRVQLEQEQEKARTNYNPNNDNQEEMRL